MKRIPVWTIILFVMVLVIGSKYLFFSKEEKQNAAASGKNKSLAVNFYVVKSRPYENKLFVTGKTAAMNEVTILPEISAKVLAIYFQEGQEVKKGELMVKLNDADFQAQLKKVQTQLKLSNQKLVRLKKLREINGVSEEEYEMQENEISVLMADEQYIQAQLAKTSILAPFSGVVGLKNVSEGAFVSPGTALVSLVQLRPIYVEFSVPGKFSSEIRMNMPVTFEVEKELGVETYSASVYAIEPRLDDATKSLRVRALYKGEKILLPGTYTKTYIGFGDFGNQLMVPSYCVVPILKGHKVYRYVAGKAIETPVLIGPRTDKGVLILKGLNEGDTVITSGLMSLKKDISVNLLKATE